MIVLSTNSITTATSMKSNSISKMHYNDFMCPRCWCQDACGLVLFTCCVCLETWPCFGGAFHCARRRVNVRQFAHGRLTVYPKYQLIARPSEEFARRFVTQVGLQTDLRANLHIS